MCVLYWYVVVFSGSAEEEREKQCDHDTAIVNSSLANRSRALIRECLVLFLSSLEFDGTLFIC